MTNKDKRKYTRRTSTQLVRLKKRMIKRLGGCCSECGYNNFYGALSFHHRDPSKKKFEWKHMKHLPYTDIIGELKKCELLCLNCHAEHHHYDDKH